MDNAVLRGLNTKQTWIFYFVEMIPLSDVRQTEGVCLSFCCSSSSVVAFRGGHRVVGVAAKERLVSNVANTILNIKRYIGLQGHQKLLMREIMHEPSALDGFSSKKETRTSFNVRSLVLCGRHVREVVFANETFQICFLIVSIRVRRYRSNRTEYMNRCTRVLASCQQCGVWSSTTDE